MNNEGYKDPTAEKAIDNVEKPRRHMTDKELFELKKGKCRFCIYATRTGDSGGNYGAIVCDYIGIVGHSRGCRPDQCDKFKRKTKRGRKKHE